MLVLNVFTAVTMFLMTGVSMRVSALGTTTYSWCISLSNEVVLLSLLTTRQFSRSPVRVTRCRWFAKCAKHDTTHFTCHWNAFPPCLPTPSLPFHLPYSVHGSCRIVPWLSLSVLYLVVHAFLLDYVYESIINKTWRLIPTILTSFLTPRHWINSCL